MKQPRCTCGCAKTRHRQANHLRHERGACTACTCLAYTPKETDDDDEQ
jgi:hypothetical protein